MRRLLTTISFLLLTTILVSVIGVPRLHGQAAPPAEKAAAFEAASVKPSQSRSGQPGASLAGGRLAMTNATLRDVIRFAYQRQDGRLRNDSEITGGPAWLNSDR